MAMVINYLGIVAVVLLGIIIYFFIRLRKLMQGAIGARSDMNTIELIKNWQAQKSVEAQRQAEIRDYAKEAARPEIERAIFEKYKQEEIAKATAPPGDRGKNMLKQGLGIDSDKIFGRENIDRIVGNRKIEGINPGVNTDKIFSQDRISKMTGHNSMDQERIKRASGNVNWDKGIRRSLDSETQFRGVDRALGRIQQPQQPPRPLRRYRPPYKP